MLDEDIGSFMDRPAADAPLTIHQRITEEVGTQIGPYKLIQEKSRHPAFSAVVRAVWWAAQSRWSGCDGLQTNHQRRFVKRSVG